MCTVVVQGFLIHLLTLAPCSKDSRHLPAWKAFNEAIGKSREDVGIWHETYQVRAGGYETVYSGMPRFGLGAAADLVPAGRAAI